MANQNLNLPPSFINEIVKSGENETIIRSNLKSVSDVYSWIEEYGKTSDTKWNLRTSRPSGTRYVCWHKFVCHHSAFRKVPKNENKRGISKNSECPATVIFKVKLDTLNVKKKDEYAKRGLFAVIVFSENHNHSLGTSETLRYLPSDDCRETFLEYFDDGMNIAEACKYHENVLEMQENFKIEMLANSRLNPTYRAVKHWYNSWRLANLGPRTGSGLIQKLKEKIRTYAEHGITVRFTEDPFAVLILTPLMLRAHGIQESEEIVFVDSTSSCDAENHCITFMLIPCAAGSIPIGIIITKGETEHSYTAGFNLLKETLQDSFNGKKHPCIFLTDKSSAEINALRNVFPESKNLLCIFHVAQAVWRWLWESKNMIPKDHRQILMHIFQKILYASNQQIAHQRFLNAVGYVGTFLPTYDNWSNYLMAWWREREKWCLAYRDHSTKGHHTNNFSEVCVRIFKDEVLSRVKAYNVLTLIDFCGNTLEKYFCRKLQKFSFSRDANPRLLLAKMLKSAEHIKKEDILQKGHVYEVKSGSLAYIVDVESGVCSCEAGLFGKFCEHQCAIFNHLDAASKNFPPVSPDDRHLVAMIALGEKCPEKSFFLPFLPETIKAKQNISTIHLPSPDFPAEPNSRPTSPHTSSEQQTANTEDEGQFNSFIEVLRSCNEKFGCSASGLKKITDRLQKISSVGQWEKFLHTAGGSIPMRRRDGSAIHVQPASIARRGPKMTKGSKRLPAGRPPAGVVPSKKRRHCLSDNINLCQPNAKLHGSGH